jgi:hypothetical protein
MIPTDDFAKDKRKDKGNGTSRTFTTHLYSSKSKGALAHSNVVFLKNTPVRRAARIRAQ